MKLRILILIFAITLIAVAGAQAQSVPDRPPQAQGAYLFPVVSTTPLLNGEFENNDKPGSCQYWDKFGMHWVCPQEVRPPLGWTAWWVTDDHTICPTPTGQPEMRWESDPLRVYSGSHSLHYFSFWQCHRAGIMQEFRVSEPKTCIASAKVAVWYSQCSERPFDPPYDYYCGDELEASHMRLRVGVSDHGFLNPPDEYVEWGEWEEHYGSGTPESTWFTITTPPTYVETGGILIIESRPNYALKHEDIYIDNILLSCR